MQSVIGLDLKNHRLSSALFAMDGQIFYRKRKALGERWGKQIAGLLLEQAELLIDFARGERRKIISAGIAIPGSFNPETGIVYAPGIPGWHDFDFSPYLEQLQHRFNTTIDVIPDRWANILGESWQGEAKGAKNAIVFSVGSGISTGIMVDGQILRGKDNLAGAAGWMTFSDLYQNGYKQGGFLEYHASGRGITQRYIEKKAMENGESPFYDKPDDELNIQDIFNAFKGGDPTAATVLDKAVHCWGLAIANLISIFNPEKIIFGGPVFGPAAQFIPKIRSEAQKWAQPVSLQGTELLLSALGGDMGLIGAGRLALMAAERDLS
jgi:glucokinase